MGLKVQLNHSSFYCKNPIPCHSAMLMIHVNKIHNITIQYCGCSKAIPQHLQLLHWGLYPASQLLVKTCAFFQVLDLLNKLALTMKSSTYDFNPMLKKLTNNTGIDIPKLWYWALFRMSIQWWHLKLLKWSGWGHNPSDVDSTKHRELAVVCPSCPHPGINLMAGRMPQSKCGTLSSNHPILNSYVQLGFFTWYSLPWMLIFASRTSLFWTIRRILGLGLVGLTCFLEKFVIDMSCCR